MTSVRPVAVLSLKPSAAVLTVWLFVAIVNLSAGLVVATWPERHGDLDTMRRWGHAWLVEGEDIYQKSDELPDYPPAAIVAFSPLSALPTRTAVPVWAAINLLLAPAAAFCAVRTSCPRRPWPELLLPTLMFLCWGGFRTLLQFTLVSLVAGFLTMQLAPRRPTLAGLFLGLSLAKPQIAAPFLLWAVFTKRWRVLGIAFAVVSVATAGYCIRVQASPIHLAIRYAAILRSIYAGDWPMVGLWQVRPLVMLMTSNSRRVDVVVVALTGSLLMAICAVGVREGRNEDAPMFSAPALAGVWSLLTFYHLSYGLLLLMPTATLLLFAPETATADFRRRLFWSLQLLMMFDVVTLWRWSSRLLGAAVEVPAVVGHLDRLAAIGLLAGMGILYARTASLRTAEGAVSRRRQHS